MTTAIPYAKESWSPVTGCSKGCTYCWSRAIAHRFGRSFAPTFHADKLVVPLHWRKPRTVVVAFNGDLFDPAITDEQIAAVFGVMAACPQHTFLVLTKRACGMAGFFRRFEERAPGPYLTPKNVWLGVSVTNQTDADERIPHLLACPAEVRWVSAEPLLGQVSLLAPYRDPGWPCSESLLFGLDWVVAGSQSGGGGPRFDLVEAWARGLRNECQREGVPFAWKNPTGFPPLDGVVHDAMPGAQP